VNPFRGGSSRLTYADPRYNKIGGPNGVGGGSPRNARWHSSAAGKCAVLAITVLFLSYSTFFAPAPPAAPNKSPSSLAGGTTPSTTTGLLSSTNNSKKATSPQINPAATDGTKASLLQPPPPAELVDSQPSPSTKDAAGPAQPEFNVPVERLDEADRGEEGGTLSGAGGEGSGSRDGGENLSRFGAEDPEVEGERGVSPPEGEAEGGEEDEDDDFAGDGRPPEMMMAKKKHINQGDDNKAEDEDDDDKKEGDRGGETRGSKEGGEDTDTTSMFQGGDDNSPGGGTKAAGVGTGGISMEVPIIKDANRESDPLRSGSGEMDGNDSREVDAAEADPGDVPAGDLSKGSKDANVDNEDNGTAGGSKLVPSEDTASANGGSRNDIPVVIPLPRDSKSAIIVAGLQAPGADKEGSPESEGPGDASKGEGDSTAQSNQPGDNGEGEGKDLGTSKDSDGKSGPAIDFLNPSLPTDVSETEHDEVDTTDAANLHGDEGVADPTHSTPEVSEADGAAVADLEDVKGGPELNAVDSPQGEVGERHIAGEVEASTTTGSNDTPIEGTPLTTIDALAADLNDTAIDELAKDLNDTIASPSAPDGEADSEPSEQGAKLGDIPVATEGDQERSANAFAEGRSGNALLRQGNADAVTADSKEEGDGAGVPDAASAAVNETVSNSTGVPVDSPDEGTATTALDNAVDPEASETADEKSKDGPKEENESPASEAVVKVKAEGSKQEEERADASEATDSTEVQPDGEKETEPKLPYTEKDPVMLQATSGGEADTDKERASKEIGDTASKKDPVPVREGSGEESDTAPLEAPSVANRRKRKRGEPLNDTSPKTDLDPSEPESTPRAKKGKKRKGDATEVEVDLDETIDGGDNEGGDTTEEDEETKKKSRRRKKPKVAADKGDSELTEAKEAAAELDEADLAKEGRPTKDKAKSHLRGANKDVEKTDRH
jgi:hypothetical protein